MASFADDLVVEVAIRARVFTGMEDGVVLTGEQTVQAIGGGRPVAAGAGRIALY